MAEWISYETDGEPAAEVSVDVDFADDEDFRRTHPFVVTVTVSGFATDAEGLPDDAVSDRLYEIEQKVDLALASNDAALTCTITGNGSFALCGYATSRAIEATIDAAIASSSFKIEVHADNDAPWAQYERYVLRGEELEEARDAEQIDQLVELGEDVTQEYEVVFDLEFDTNEGLRRSLQPLRDAGFAALDETYEGQTVASATLTMPLTTEGLKAARARLLAVVTPLGGHYDGWGADPLEEE